jgi:hypothetical protein
MRLPTRMPPPWHLAFVTAVCLVMIAPSSHARSAKQFHFRVELATGQVRRLERESATPLALHAPVASQNAATYDNTGKVRLVERRPDGTLHTRLELTVGDDETEWMPWSVVQGGWLVFAWCDIGTPGARAAEPVHVWYGVELATRKVRWQRTSPVHMPPGAARLGDTFVVVDTPTQIEIIDVRTGASVRSIPKSDESASLHGVPGDRLLVEAGAELHMLNRSGATEWRIKKSGSVRHALGLDTRPWLIKTTSHTYSIEPGTGTLTWSAESPSEGKPVMLRGRIYEAWHVTTPVGEHVISLVERDAKGGKLLRRWPVQKRSESFDIIRAEVVAASADTVDVMTGFIVLD